MNIKTREHNWLLLENRDSCLYFLFASRENLTHLSCATLASVSSVHTPQRDHTCIYKYVSIYIKTYHACPKVSCSHCTETLRVAVNMESVGLKKRVALFIH